METKLVVSRGFPVCEQPNLITIALQYVMSLVNDDNEDEVRFQVPTFVGQRYGIPPSGLEVAVAPSSHTRVSITADIQTCGRIEAIISPSHPDISETRYSTHLGRLSRRRSTVKFRSNSFLERDFMLIVRAEKLDSPRCFAELQHDPNGRAPDTIAMQLTIVPKFDLPPVDAQEYLFLVDRSGSMSGGRIDHAKRTLVMLLRMIPAQGSIFNIFSFGTDSTSLWRQSCQYDQASLNAAVSCHFSKGILTYYASCSRMCADSTRRIDPGGLRRYRDTQGPKRCVWKKV